MEHIYLESLEGHIQPSLTPVQPEPESVRTLAVALGVAKVSRREGFNTHLSTVLKVTAEWKYRQTPWKEKLEKRI